MLTYDGRNLFITNGYYDVYYPDHPNARKNGSVMLQILVAEKMLGRYLKKGEVVHHKDFNRLNNECDNLMVFASQSDHMMYHSMLTDIEHSDKYVFYQKDGVFYCMDLYTFEHKDKIIRKHGIRYKPCPLCNTLILYSSQYCTVCQKIQSRHVQRPSRIELKFLIRNNSFLSIGRKYGVSDNAVRKWCKFYELPTHSNEIKKFSDIDWEKI